MGSEINKNFNITHIIIYLKPTTGGDNAARASASESWRLAIAATMALYRKVKSHHRSPRGATKRSRLSE